MFKSQIAKDEIEKLPLKGFEGTVTVIQSGEEFEQILPELESQPILGFDTETKPSFKKGKSNKLALIQLSTENNAYLIRVHKMTIPDALHDILQNENILKIGVALNDDLRAIRKVTHADNLSTEPDGFIDLQKFVKQFDIEDNSLKKLTANILNFRISKRQQLSNWEAKTLSEAQITYAATDAWVCYMMYKKLQEVYNV